MNRILILLIAFTISTQLFGQKNYEITRCDELYKMYAYSDAVDGYLKLHKKNPENEYYIQQIAFCYQKMGAYKNALPFYEKHVKGKRARTEDHYQYALLLLIDQQFEKAKQEFLDYKKINPEDKRANDQISRIENFTKLNLLKLVDTIFLEPFNTRFADMSAAYYQGSIMYVSGRDSSGGETYSWNNEPFLDIFQIKSNSSIEKVSGVNTKYHEGPMAFTNNDSTIWFTRNNQKFTGATGEQTSNLRIYISTNDGKKWGKCKEFQYNSDDYSVGHPAFSPDGNTLYFASNMPGSIGETDLFRIKKIQTENSKGEWETTWSVPENLGKQFNTTGKEMFPYVDTRGVIFFASDGLIGFGGLDIFAAFPVADSFNVINLGQPINSTYDDFSFIINDALSEGYLTSNRPGGVGSDDIYSFKVGKQKLYINVISLKSKQPIANSTVKYTLNGKSSILGQTDSNGKISMDVEYDKGYDFDFSHPGFISQKDSLPAFGIFKLTDHALTVFLDNVEQTFLDVTVLNDENNEPVSGATVVVTPESGSQQKYVTDGSGRIKYVVKAPDKIKVGASKEKFMSAEKKVSIDKIGKGDVNTIIKIAPIYEGKTFVLENLYYDLGKWNIRPDAALVLDQLLKILVDNPTIKIELSSHTDSRASAASNQTLSQKRAQSAVDYLVLKGINRNRMIAKGYGESKLLNKCADGVQCSEEEHQKNRRTEFKVTDL
ncbi:MAG TPA: OmpA family protein [Prolixibacteraceae bacterium]|nr:OmpA family protein [Prolixibacteraceae bacterium]